MKKGFAIDIEKATKENENFRKVLYTAENSQLVVMSLKAGEDIGEEVHELDQFIRLEEGKGIALIGETKYEIEDDWAIVIPAGSLHNVTNTGDTPMKLYTVYSPPEHLDGTIHTTKEEAKEEHFDGKTTE